MDQVHSVEHRAHTLSKPERATHPIAAPLLRFDLPEERDRLRQERPYLDGDRNAKTLVKSGRYRLVLVVLKPGAVFDEENPRGDVSLLVRDGRVSVTVEGETTEVGTGQVAAIEAGHAWSARAIDESVVVLNFSWPPEPGDVTVLP